MDRYPEIGEHGLIGDLQYSEESGLTGEQLSNSPRAFSHLAHVNAAPNLNFQLDQGTGWTQPVLSAGRRGN